MKKTYDLRLYLNPELYARPDPFDEEIAPIVDIRGWNHKVGSFLNICSKLYQIKAISSYVLRGDPLGPFVRCSVEYVGGEKDL